MPVIRVFGWPDNTEIHPSAQLQIRENTDKTEIASTRLLTDLPLLLQRCNDH